MAKASIEISVVQDLLQRLYPNTLKGNVVQIKSGSSSAVGFTFNPDTELVILFRRKGEFAKEIAVRKLLDNSAVPAPKIIASGEATNILDYLIVEKAEGVVVDDDADVRTCIEAVMPVFTKISSTDHRRAGFGFWNPITLDAPFKTWKEFILDMTTGDWSVCRDQESVYIAHELIKKYLDKLPEQNALLHGDMSGGNFFVGNGKTTAVIDWELSMFGDPIYEYAYMTVFYPDTLTGVLKAIPNIEELDSTNWTERFLCCRLYPLLKYTRMHYLEDSVERQERAKYYENILRETVKDLSL